VTRALAARGRNSGDGSSSRAPASRCGTAGIPMPRSFSRTTRPRSDSSESVPPSSRALENGAPASRGRAEARALTASIRLTVTATRGLFQGPSRHVAGATVKALPLGAERPRSVTRRGRSLVCRVRIRPLGQRRGAGESAVPGGGSGRGSAAGTGGPHAGSDQRGIGNVMGNVRIAAVPGRALGRSLAAGTTSGRSVGSNPGSAL